MKKIFILLMGLLCFAQTKAQLLDSLVFNYDSIQHYENAYDYILDPIDKSGLVRIFYMIGFLVVII